MPFPEKVARQKKSKFPETRMPCRRAFACNKYVSGEQIPQDLQDLCRYVYNMTRVTASAGLRISFCSSMSLALSIAGTPLSR